MKQRLAFIGGILALSCMLLGQSTEKPATFEIADVHPSAPSALGQLAGASGGIPRGGRYELRNASMVDLITRAYDVTDDKVAGGPNWLASDRFDVIAKTPPSVSVENARLMLRALLADRFALKVHNDNKPLPTYVLTLGKGAHKLKKSDGGQSGCQVQQSPPQPGAAPFAQAACHNLTGAQIAQNLSQVRDYIDHPLVDQTNLEGAWDFDLKITPRAALGAAGADGISLFDAVEKQLGLKIGLRQIAAAVVVVDSVNRKPTDNPPGVAEALPPEKPEFEAAEIKPDPPGTQGVGIQYTQGGRINARGTLRDLIGMANEILPNTVGDFVIGPKFIETTHWTIVAKAPSTGIGAPTRDAGRDIPPPINVALMMLRNTLEERFKLQTHTEDRQVTVYALVAKGESKMKKAEPSERANCKADPAAVPTTAGGPMQAITCTNETIAEFIKLMPQMAPAYIDHPVIDNTGLQGGYDFTVMWTPRGALPGGGQAGATGAVDPGGVTYFEAIEKLGLKLEKGTHPVRVIVIDHAEEKPID